MAASYQSIIFLLGTSLILFSTSGRAHGEKVDYAGYKIVSPVAHDEAQSDLLNGIVDDMELQLLSDVNRLGVPVDVLVPPRKFTLFIDKVYKEGIQYEVDVDDVQMMIDQETANLPPSTRSGEFDHDTYHDLDGINAILDRVEINNSERVSTSVIGTTYEKRPIRLVKVSSGSKSNETRRGILKNKNKDIIFFDCGIHAREWVSPATCLWIIEKLLNDDKDKTVTRLLDTYDFYIIPVVNPDGYVYSRKSNRFWRKNRKPFGRLLPNCTGVDPNRNFEFHFGEKGTSIWPCSDAYHGPKAFSEAESQAYRDIILKLKDRLKLVITIHAYSQLWMTPYGHDSVKSNHYHEHMRVSKIAVDALQKVYGTSFKYGPINTIIYAVGGSSTDWVYETADIPMTFALELRDKGRFGFLLPPSQIVPTATETWAGLAALIDALK